jgi:hypothetical protein
MNVKFFSVLLGPVALVATLASAQSISDQLKGTWSATSSGPCGLTNIQIVGVEQSGVVRGSLECTLRRITLTLGDKKELDRAMAANLSGNNLRIDGANSGFDLTYQEGRLVGFAVAGQGSKRPIEFTKK